ncbi:MAG: hypothetical protein AB7U71_02635 [Comamonas sp.]
MADQSTSETTEHDIFNEFLKEKNANRSCPVCGSHSWQHVAPGDDQTFAYIATNDKGETLINPISIPIMAVICGECFFLRTHAKKPILSWHEKRSSTKQPSSEGKPDNDGVVDA